MPAIGSRTSKLHRVPLAWLAAAILLATIAGCIVTIVLAQRYPDESVASGDSLLNVQLD